jgi:hypothetical protein
MTLNRYLMNHEHVHRFNVTPQFEGWEVIEERDSAVLRRAQHEDWHRVETDAELFEIKASALKGEGWTEAGDLENGNDAIDAHDVGAA